MDVPVAPEPLAVQRQALTKHGARPQTAQRHAAGPVLRAAALDRQEHARLEQERAHVQRQVAALGEVTAVERQADPRPVPDRPTTPAEWVTVMRARAEEVQGRPLDSRSSAAFTALQRQVAQTLAQGFRADRGDAQARYATYGEHLATLQRHPVSAPVARVVLGLVPPAERLLLQRAVDETLQRFQAQEQAALNFDTLQTLQRQLAELDAEATQPVLQRIQARRGAGSPLPEAIQRHLEQGLNHDLSRVRIHDDAEADKLAKGVNAIAFTTGTDIFFQSGHFNPNTQSGLELLAHEVTHTVQQSQGRVGTGIDPDAGLESEARTMGARLAKRPGKHRPTLPAVTAAPRHTSSGLLVQRQAAPGQPAFKFRDVNFWKPIPGAMFEGAKQALVDVWELIKNLPVIAQQLPELTRKAVAWLRTMDTLQEWKAVAQALGMGALTAGQNWLKQTAAQQGAALGRFVGQMIGEFALGKGAGAALKALKGGGGVVKMFDDFTDRVDSALHQMGGGGPRPALAGAGYGPSLPSPARPGSVRTPAPLPSLSSPSRMTAAAPTSGEVISKALQTAMDAKNWNAVRALLGKAPPAKLPDGYFYRTLENGKKQIVRKKADDDQFVMLTIDENGKVQVADPNVSDRISVASAMKRNFKAAMGRAVRDGYQLHHLIPDNLVRSHPLMQLAMAKGYDLDRASNLLEMPGRPEVRQSVQEIVGHFGSHDKYDKQVKDRLDLLLATLKDDHPGGFTDTDLMEAIRTLEDQLRELFRSGTPPTRWDPDTKSNVLTDAGPTPVEGQA